MGHVSYFNIVSMGTASFLNLCIVIHSLIRTFTTMSFRYFFRLQAALLGADKPAVVATDAPSRRR